MRISYLVSELQKHWVPESKRLELRIELDDLLIKRRRQLETLAKVNTYMPENIDDSSDVDV